MKKPLLPPCLVCGRRTAESLAIHDACVLPGFRQTLALWFFFHVLTAYRVAPWPPLRLTGVVGKAGGSGGRWLSYGGAGGRGRKGKR